MIDHAGIGRNSLIFLRRAVPYREPDRGTRGSLCGGVQRTLGLISILSQIPRALPAGIQGRTERMSADARYGVGMRWLVLTPSPSPAKLERGDQNRARGRSHAVQATLARMFYPPLNPQGGARFDKLTAGGLTGAPQAGKPGFPVCSPQARTCGAHTDTMNMSFSWEGVGGAAAPRPCAQTLPAGGLVPGRAQPSHTLPRCEQ